MLRYFYLLIFFSCQITGAQNNLLAKQYFDDGEYEKAIVYYVDLVKKNNNRKDYIETLITAYQETEQFDKAEQLLLEKIKQSNRYPDFHIILGHNYELQQQKDKAKTQYEAVFPLLEKNPNFAYILGKAFSKYTLLDYASKTYNRAMELNPKLNFNYQLARIYGEQGNIEKMFGTYLDMLEKTPQLKMNVLRGMSLFIKEDKQHKNNLSLKKLLLQRLQKNPDIIWNDLLSWLYYQQKQFNLTFIQEKAIYKRKDEASLLRMENLARTCAQQKQQEIGIKVYTFITEKSNDEAQILKAHLNILRLKNSDTENIDTAQLKKDYLSLLDTYGYELKTVPIQVSYARFLAFTLSDTTTAIELLKNTLKLPLFKFSVAEVKVCMADILVLEKRFNEALIYYSQIQKSLKNHTLGQEARFKIAKTSFYKGDFDWALTQLKVLRNSTSQLIANDAMHLSLLISDNTFQDSTQVALKKYATADFMAFQGKTKEAISIIDQILEEHKGAKIEDEALFKQGQLLEQQKNYEKAKLNYLKILDFFKEDILADNALFALAKLYDEQFEDKVLAKKYYEQLIFEYEDSIYFQEARKRYRILRGDDIN